MEKITIIIREHGVEIVDGRIKSAALRFWVPGQLDIYVFGPVRPARWNWLVYHALNELLNRHIPLEMLRGVDLK